LKNPITKQNVGIVIITLLLVAAFNIYENPDFLNLKDPDEISNEELLERSLDITDKGLTLLNRILSVESLGASVIIGLLIGVAIFVGLEIRNKRKS